MAQDTGLANKFVKEMTRRFRSQKDRHADALAEEISAELGLSRLLTPEAAWGGKEAAQHTFSGVVKHLRQQGTQCLDEDGSCVFLCRLSGDDYGKHLRCAVGGIIPLRLHRTWFDEVGVVHPGGVITEAAAATLPSPNASWWTRVMAREKELPLMVRSAARTAALSKTWEVSAVGQVAKSLGHSLIMCYVMQQVHDHPGPTAAETHSVLRDAWEPVFEHVAYIFDLKLPPIREESCHATSA